MADTLIPKELKQRLEVLAEEDKGMVLHFAARAALRIFPVLGSKGNFNHWPEQDQAKHISAIWHCLLLSYLTSPTMAYQPAPKASRAMLAANASRKTAHDYVSEDVAIAVAEVADAYAYKDISRATRAAVRVVNVYAGVADRAYVPVSIRASDIKRANARNAIRAVADEDLNMLEVEGLRRMKYQALWHQNIAIDLEQISPDLEKIVNTFFPRALTKLANKLEKKDIEIARIIKSIYPLYKGILQGKPEEEALGRSLQDVDHYLERFFKENKNKRRDQEKPQISTDISKASDDSIEESPEGKITTSYTNTHIYHAENAVAEDSLNREALVKVLSAMIADKRNGHHQTIGLLGDWGVGKSTFLKLLKKDLLDEQKEQAFLFAEFNAWEYEHTDNLQAGIAQEMIKALSKPCYRDSYTEAPRGWLLDRFKEVSWFGPRLVLTLKFAASLHGWRLLWPLLLIFAAVMPFAVDDFKSILSFMPVSFTSKLDTLQPWGSLSWIGFFIIILFKEFKKLFANPLAKEFLTYLKLPNYGEHLGMIPVMRENIKTLTQVRLEHFGEKKRLVYVVDDLDRCDMKNIVKVFEAIKLVLDIPNVTVIIAVDQRIALAALSLHYKDLKDYHHSRSAKAIARDYLAKILHMSVTLTKPDEGSVDHYLQVLWGDGGLSNLSAEKQALHSELNAPKENKLEKPDVEVEALSENESEVKPEGVKVNQDQVKLKTSGESKPEVRNIPLEGLDGPKKESFSALLIYFTLVNPRQVKRLDNAYKILRHYYDKDHAAGSRLFDRCDVFPLMVTLFALEYINEIDDAEKREKLKAYLSGKVTRMPVEDDKINIDIAKITRANLGSSKVALIQAVEPFVLPAIDNVSDQPIKKK